MPGGTLKPAARVELFAGACINDYARVFPEEALQSFVELLPLARAQSVSWRRLHGNSWLWPLQGEPLDAARGCTLSRITFLYLQDVVWRRQR